MAVQLGELWPTLDNSFNESQRPGKIASRLNVMMMNMLDVLIIILTSPGAGQGLQY